MGSKIVVLAHTINDADTEFVVAIKAKHLLDTESFENTMLCALARAIRAQLSGVHDIRVYITTAVIDHIKWKIIDGYTEMMFLNDFSRARSAKNKKSVMRYVTLVRYDHYVSQPV